MKQISWGEIRKSLRQYRQRRNEKREIRREARRNSRFGQFMGKVCAVMNRISLLLHAIWACVLYFIMEAISRHSLVQGWKFMVGSPLVFLFNAFTIFATLLLVYLVRRRVFLRTVISALWLLLGCVNGYMLSVRVTPFNAQDFNMILDATTMLDKYLSDGQGVLIIVGLTVAITCIVLIGIKGPKFKGKMRHLIAGIAAVIGIGAISPLTNLAIEQRVVSNYFGNIAFAYQDYGLIYCFLASVFDTGIDQPNAYTEEEINKIAEEDKLFEVSASRKEMPNIIMIQLESFFDTNEVEFFTTSEDPIPTFHYLMQNYSSGYCKVPSVGAGTANTEFEVLTGMNLRYFGPGEYPYKTLAKYKELESVATALKEFGYGAHALHNNGGNFYSRADVFNNMGFDSYTSKEFMNILQKTENGWATDDILVEHILNALNSTEQQDLVFGITVEGHGDYPEEKVIENPRIEIQGIEDEGKKNSWEYYVNHLYETDQMIADLLAELEKRGEPAVVVLYGDHLPTMGLEAKDLKNRYLYNTNYVIWDNIGLKKQDRNVPTYQLVSELFSRLEIHSGTVFNYHQNRRKTKQYLKDLEILQYDALYGEHYIYGGKPYETNREDEFHMGILDVKITGFAQNFDGSYSIYGEHFTANSKVYINDVKQITQFLNNTRIELKEAELEEGDVLVISQVGSSNRIFRSTEKFIYNQGKLVPAEEYVPPAEDAAEDTAEQPKASVDTQTQMPAEEN